MKLKSNLKTIRLTTEEKGALDRFIHTHPYLNDFSKLVRAALREYIKNNPAKATGSKAPSFLWEYKLNEEEIFEILSGPQKNRLWLVAKILEHGKWEEIWHYLTRSQIEQDMPLLRLAEKTKTHWQYALNRWRKYDKNSDTAST
ncbi:MAG: hypothetical protein Q7T03_10570 [Deltaproteobacteria bacterium]|nr:hypothetical protein [Deltaproteobacteria bacterium]